MNIGEKGYIDLMTNILSLGKDKVDRTGVGTRGFFGRQLHFDLRQGFPLLTTKKVFFRGVVEELLWFLSGSTNVKPLQEKDVHIWDEWATKEQCARFGRQEGDLGPVYGHQWRNFGAEKTHKGQYAQNGVDQIARVINDIQKSPYSRRHIVTGWNPKEADEVALPPCHTLFQFHVMPSEAGCASCGASDVDCDINPGNCCDSCDHEHVQQELSCHMYMRSADLFLGVPFNIASYALLTHMVAAVCQLKVGDLVVSFGDVHIYKNHFDQCKEQLMRGVRAPPKLSVVVGSDNSPKVPAIDAFKYENFKLEGYDPHPAIKAEVAV